MTETLTTDAWSEVACWSITRHLSLRRFHMRLRRGVILRAVLLVLLLPAAVRAEEEQLPPRPAVRALAVTEPILVDGDLSDGAWARAERAGDFTQLDPEPGAPPSEVTEFQVAYTRTTLYFAVRAAVADPRLLVVKEMERDRELRTEDSVMIVLDTFGDRRNAYVFATNANGARTDRLITDEGRDINDEWDGVWSVAARRTADGWVAEIAIPFSTLRFQRGLETWGLNVQRVVGYRDEESHWAALPVALRASPSFSLRPVYRVSLAGELRGLGDLETGRQVDVKPYTLTSYTQRPSQGDSESDVDVGLDLKWGPTRSLALDLTYNTDFAEVEVDDVQFNLTRFSLFFPEKREFFLENAGIFDFGPPNRYEFDPPLLKVFFSRRIGLVRGEVVPLLGGVRLTGRVGGFNLGLLDVEAKSVADLGIPETNFGVVRLKRNLGRRSSVGALFTQRDEGDRGTNRVFGLDLEVKPTTRTEFTGFLSKSDDPEVASDELAWGLGTEYRDGTRQASFDVEEVQQGYRPDMGFLLRGDFRRYNPRVQWLPRIERWGQHNWFMSAQVDYFERSSDGRLESRLLAISPIGTRTKGNDTWNLEYRDQTERLFEPFVIFPGVVIPVGTYRFAEWRFQGRSNLRRPVGFRWRIEWGDFYGGDRIGGRITVPLRFWRHFRSELQWSFNDIELPQGQFTTNLYQPRFDITFTPDLRLNVVAQYNDATDELGINVRFNWIYRPGADLFVVYNENWVAPTISARQTRDRQVIVKFTHLFRR